MRPECVLNVKAAQGAEPAFPVTTAKCQALVPLSPSDWWDLDLGEEILGLLLGHQSIKSEWSFFMC